MDDEYGIEVEVRGQISKGYRLKVNVTSIGMYVDGFTARESDRNVSGYWIQPPAQQINHKWIHVPEFSTKTDFWARLEEKCLHAIGDYDSSPTQRDKVYQPTDEDLDQPINLDDVPF